MSPLNHTLKDGDPMKNAASDIPVGSTWYEREPVLADGTIRPARVLTTVEGYVVARFKGAMPFVCGHGFWRRKFIRVVTLNEWDSMTGTRGAIEPRSGGQPEAHSDAVNERGSASKNGSSGPRQSPSRAPGKRSSSLSSKGRSTLR